MARCICSAVYVGFTIAVKTGSFALGGHWRHGLPLRRSAFVLDQGLLRFVRGNELRQVLLTLGFAFVLNDLALVIWGGDSFYGWPIPQIAARRPSGVLRRVFLPDLSSVSWLVTGILVFAALWPACSIIRGAAR